VLLVVEAAFADAIVPRIREAVSDPTLEIIETCIASGAKVVPID
jgi:hypothetical protein